jgi:hypothetical protein
MGVATTLVGLLPAYGCFRYWHVCRTRNYYGVQASFLSETFPSNLRYSGASLAYQIATPLGGGLVPLGARRDRRAGGGPKRREDETKVR